MANTLECSEEKTIENIANEDWPLLKELESTRFSLKNKKGRRKLLSTIKGETEQEDLILADQGVEDEKLVETFLESVANETNVAEIKIKEIHAREMLETPIQLTLPLEEKPVVDKKEKTLNTVVEKIKPLKNEDFDDQNTAKLIAVGMAKIYINKTDSILNPLRFILRNGLQVFIALIQFIIPGIITWQLISSVPYIANELSKESSLTYGLYVFIFYFACMFLWITGQVIAGGIWNMIKYMTGNLLKAGKN